MDVRRKELSFRIAKWLFFGVLISVLPLALGGVSAATRKDVTFRFEGMYENGELLIVAAAIVGAALTELFSLGDQGLRLMRFLAGCFAATVVIASATWFADIAAATRDGSALDHDAIASGSLWVFISAVLSGLSCIVVATYATKRPG